MFFVLKSNAQTDKVAHFGVGFASAAITTSLFQRYDVKYAFWYGILTSTLLGVGKEIYDKKSGKGNPEVYDALATIGGGVLGAFTVHISIPIKYKQKSQLQKSN